METRVRVGNLAENFIRALPPEPRREVLRAIKGLGRDTGDVKALEGKLAPYWRLRVNRIRVVYAQKSVAGRRVLFCFYANYRPVVYQLVEQLLAQDLIAELRQF
ncbi:MAG: type II toxin-antitoxin system RelE family toxin [Limisphaerales bacterium]